MKKIKSVTITPSIDYKKSYCHWLKDGLKLCGTGEAKANTIHNDINGVCPLSLPPCPACDALKK